MADRVQLKCVSTVPAVRHEKATVKHKTRLQQFEDLTGDLFDVAGQQCLEDGCPKTVSVPTNTLIALFRLAGLAKASW